MRRSCLMFVVVHEFVFVGCGGVFQWCTQTLVFTCGLPTLPAHKRRLMSRHQKLQFHYSISASLPLICLSVHSFSLRDTCYLCLGKHAPRHPVCTHLRTCLRNLNNILHDPQHGCCFFVRAGGVLYLQRTLTNTRKVMIVTVVKFVSELRFQ